jgi:hypothetical protein
LRNYRDLEVWRKAHKLTLLLYQKSRSFPKEEFYGLTSQLRRSATSIGANLAEDAAGRQRLDLRALCGSRWALPANWTITFCLHLISDIYTLMNTRFSRRNSPVCERCWPHCLRRWNLEQSKGLLGQAESANLSSIRSS